MAPMTRSDRAHVKVSLTDGRAVVLRPLERRDAAAAKAFFNRLLSEHEVNKELGILRRKKVTLAEETRFVNDEVREMKKGKVAGLAAFDGARVVGHCRVDRRESPDESHTGVLGIAILESHRGAGLGEALMRGVLAEARRNGVTLVELQVFAINFRAIALYKKMGFRVSGVVPGKIRRYGRRIDEVSMYTDLEEAGAHDA